MARVYVGMSGGVDSSVTAAILQEQGHDVTGVYMKNWATDLPGFTCPWAEDLADAKRVAVQLGIPFKVFDFQKEYKQQVVDYMIAEYQAGRTPNPDIMCNQEIKFNLFLQAALADGAEMIATGHYARVQGSEATGEDGRGLLIQGSNAITSNRSGRRLLDHQQAGDGGAANLLAQRVLPFRQSGGELLASAVKPLDRMVGRDSIRRPALLTGLDGNKDQSYFLYRITEEALQHTLMPIGELTKPQVRDRAAELGLVTATKKDSQGICFVGQIGIKEFLQNYVTAEPGEVVDRKTGAVLGQHDGAIFYTIGQRHGLGLGGGLPYYVVGKDMVKNEVYVTTDLNDQNLWRDQLELNQLHWINRPPEVGKVYQVRTRYRAKLIDATIETMSDDTLTLRLYDPERAITAGQSVVFYEGQRVVGGGIITA